jgi:hypothetical protein
MAAIPTLHALRALSSLFSQATTISVELLRATSFDSPLVAFLLSSTALPFCVIFRSSISHVLGQILLGILVLGHERVHHGHGLIHISHERLLILVDQKIPPFARVHQIPKIDAIFFIFFGAFGSNGFFVTW